MGGWTYHWLYLDFWCPLWPNIAASAVVYAFVVVKLHAMQKLHEETLALTARHHREHMQALDLDTPGGLAAVVSEVKDAKNAAQTAEEAMKMLTSVLAPKTQMTKKAPRKTDV